MAADDAVPKAHERELLDVAEAWQPANPRQHPPFESGNEMAVRHGAYSPRHVEPVAKRLVDALLADGQVNYLAAPSYRAALWRWAQRQARADLIWSWLQDHGQCEGCGECAGLETRWHRFDTAASKAGERLGLDPLSRARLGRDIAAASVDVASLLSDERAAHEAGDVIDATADPVLPERADGVSSTEGADR